MTYLELHQWVVRELSAAGVANADQEGRWIAEHALADFAKRLVVRAHDAASKDLVQRIEESVYRRALGEPLQHVLGTTEFYGLELATPPGVLIPRPETECLVDLVLRTSHPPGPVLDLCCGSGAIALALAAEFAPSRRIVASDKSAFAVEVTRRNAGRLGLDIEVVQGDLFESVSGRFAVIATNPPYVSTGEYRDLDPAVRDHEPEEALTAGVDGLDVIRGIATEAPGFLVPDGRLFCEIGAGQGADAGCIIQAAGFVEVRVHPDRAGRDRIVEAKIQAIR